MNLATNNIIMITITYHLKPFGFFAHQALDNGPNEPVTNFALLDIRTAFE